MIVRNDTLKSGAWTGTILDTTVPVTDDLTMMTAVLRALAADGFSWAGWVAQARKRHVHHLYSEHCTDGSS